MRTRSLPRLTVEMLDLREEYDANVTEQVCINWRIRDVEQDLKTLGLTWTDMHDYLNTELYTIKAW